MGDSQGSGGSGQGNRRALGMQDWTMWPQYLNEALWGKIMDYEGYRSLDALQLVVSHLHSLGLRHPSEPTQASLTAVLVLRELEHAQRRMLGSDNGRSLYLTVKASLHSKLQKLKHGEAPLTPAEYIVELPAQVTEAPASLQAACSPIAAPKIEMLQILKLARQIPLRNTSKELKGIQGQPETNGFKAEFRRWMGMFTMFSGMQRQESECPIQFLQPRKAQLAGMLHRAQSAEALAQPHASTPLALTNDAAAHSVHGVANQALALPATVPVPDAQDAVAVRAPQAAVPCPQPQAAAPNDSKKFSLMGSVARYQQAKAEKGAKSDTVDMDGAGGEEGVESGLCLKRPARKQAGEPAPTAKARAFSKPSKPSPKAKCKASSKAKVCKASSKAKVCKPSSKGGKAGKVKPKRAIVTGDAKVEFLKRIPAKFLVEYSSGCHPVGARRTAW